MPDLAKFYQCGCAFVFYTQILYTLILQQINKSLKHVGN